MNDGFTNPFSSSQAASNPTGHNPNDVDGAVSAQHHTLGPKPTQAAPGNHNHSGLYVPENGLVLPGRNHWPVDFRDNTFFNLIDNGTITKSQVIITDGGVAVTPTLKINNTTDADRFTYAVFNVRANTDYTISARYYITPGATFLTGRAMLMVTNFPVTASIKQKFRDVDTTGAWIKITTTFNSGSNTSVTLRLYTVVGDINWAEVMITEGLRETAFVTPDPIDSGWKNATMLNSWLNFGGIYSLAGYRRLGQVVYLRGVIKIAVAPATPSTIFTLPVGYRPVSTKLLPVISNNVIGRVDIDTSGNVLYQAGGGVTTYLSLEGLSLTVD